MEELIEKIKKLKEEADGLNNMTNLEYVKWATSAKDKNNHLQFKVMNTIERFINYDFEDEIEWLRDIKGIEYEVGLYQPILFRFTDVEKYISSLYHDLDHDYLPESIIDKIIYTYDEYYGVDTDEAEDLLYRNCIEITQDIQNYLKSSQDYYKTAFYNLRKLELDDYLEERISTIREILPIEIDIKLKQG